MVPSILLIVGNGALREIAGVDVREAGGQPRRRLRRRRACVSADAVRRPTEERAAATFEVGARRRLRVGFGPRRLRRRGREGARGGARRFVGRDRLQVARGVRVRRMTSECAAGTRSAIASRRRRGLCSGWSRRWRTSAAALAMDPRPQWRRLARAATEASRLAPRADVGELWTSLGGKVGLGRGFGARNEEAMARSAEATSAVVDELLDVVGDARGKLGPAPRSMAACTSSAPPPARRRRRAWRRSRRPPGRTRARRRAMALVSASLACPVASATHTPWLAQLAAVAVACAA